MAASASPSSKRRHRKSLYLNDQELEQFNLAQKVSSLNESEFMRRRCLAITKRRLVSLSQIQIYQQLGVLQQQTAQILEQLQEQPDLQLSLEDLLAGIKTLRRQVAQLEAGEANPIEAPPN
ncbi:MAG: hypothetical protein ACKO7W_09800 [Elainella sp.]